MLVAAHLHHLAGTHWGNKPCLCMDELIKRDTLATAAA